MEGGTHCNPRSVEEVRDDFNARRNALIKALTTDFDDFFKQCDPDKGNLCLVGLPSGNWEVSVAAEQVPTDLPEPALGINFARDKMQEEQWVALVSVRSDAWLFSVAHYFGAKVGFSQADRIQLFDMINNHPTVYETVYGIRRNLEKDSNNSKPSSEGKQQSEAELKNRKRVDDGAIAEEGDDRVLCRACGKSYSSSDSFWIKCCFCNEWFHGRCVGTSIWEARYIKKYKCAYCPEKKCLAKKQTKKVTRRLSSLRG